MPKKRTTKTPAKKKTKGGAVRLTNHKTRSKWFQARSSWPVREAPVVRLMRERARVSESLAAAEVESEWECVGPNNIGGRVTSIVSHPGDPRRIWIGAAGGGVWHSSNGGRKWERCWSDQDILNIGSLAIDERNPDIIYCGTGEANLSSDCYPGIGLYRSTDGGQSWKLLASSSETGIPRGIGVIAIRLTRSICCLAGSALPKSAPRKIVWADFTVRSMGARAGNGGVLSQSRTTGAIQSCSIPKSAASSLLP